MLRPPLGPLSPRVVEAAASRLPVGSNRFRSVRSSITRVTVISPRTVGASDSAPPFSPGPVPIHSGVKTVYTSAAFVSRPTTGPPILMSAPGAPRLPSRPVVRTKEAKAAKVAKAARTRTGTAHSTDGRARRPLPRPLGPSHRGRPQRPRLRLLLRPCYPSRLAHQAALHQWLPVWPHRSVPLPSCLARQVTLLLWSPAWPHRPCPFRLFRFPRRLVRLLAHRRPLPPCPPPPAGPPWLCPVAYRPFGTPFLFPAPRLRLCLQPLCLGCLPRRFLSPLRLRRCRLLRQPCPPQCSTQISPQQRSVWWTRQFRGMGKPLSRPPELASSLPRSHSRYQTK